MLVFRKIYTHCIINAIGHAIEFDIAMLLHISMYNAPQVDMTKSQKNLCQNIPDLPTGTDVNE